MSENLEKIKNNLPIPIEMAIDIAYQAMRGEIIGVEDIAKYANLTVTQSINLITNPIFTQMVHHLTLANAKHSFDAIGFKELIRIAKTSDNDRDRISAIKTLGEMVGYNESKKSTPKVEVTFNIDQVIRERKVIPFKGF